MQFPTVDGEKCLKRRIRSEKSCIIKKRQDLIVVMFSCVIPVLGERPYFKDVLASVRNQGVDVEVIVQDGDIEIDSGQSDALNKGFAKAHGDWLFWLNADDVLLPGALNRVLDVIERDENIEWIAGDTVYLNEKGIVKDVRCDARWRSWFGCKLSVWTGGPSAFFRRSLWERLGGFDTSLKYVMDIDLWTRWAMEGVRFASLNDYVWGFRLHNGSKTGSGGNRADQLEEWSRVDAKYGVASTGLWRNVTRAASVLDGSWLKRKIDSARFRGRHWSDMGQ